VPEVIAKAVITQAPMLTLKLVLLQVLEYFVRQTLIVKVVPAAGVMSALTKAGELISLLFYPEARFV